jgi:heterodisulfide reductase subunit D
MIEDNYSIRDLLAMEACTNCRLCAESCPAVLASGNGKLSGVHRLTELKKINKKREGLLARMLKKKPPSPEDLEPYSETVFRCTLCGNCQEVCPVGIHLKDIWLSIRKDMVQADSYPKNNLYDPGKSFPEPQCI